MRAYPHSAGFLAVLSLVPFLVARLAAEDNKLPQIPLAGDAVAQLIQDRDYAAAIAAIDKALQAEAPAADYLLYLKGRAYHGQEQYDAAAKAFGQLAEQYPESVWCRKARFAAGVAMARKGDFQAAEQIYRTEAGALLDPSRKQELAAIHLEFADRYYQPDEEDQEPDYARAVLYYEQALHVGLQEERRAQVQLRVARCRQQLKDFSQAEALYGRFITDHPDSPLVIEARFRLGECRSSESKPRQARTAWQDLLAAHGESDSDFVAQASFQLSRTWGVPQPETDQQLELGVASLEAFLARFPEHELASQAYLDIAKSYLHNGRQDDAVGRLEQMLGDEQYREREEIAEGQSLLGEAYHQQKDFAKALEAYREYLANYPTDAGWSGVQQQVIDAEYLMGLEQFNTEDFEAARQTLGQFMVKYPLDRRVPGILVLYGRMHYQQQQFDEAVANWRLVAKKYPETEESSYAQYSIGVVLEEDLGKPKEALVEYEKVTWGEHASQAQSAATRLTEKTMTVVTERVFRSDETPRVKLSTRNIESVQVRVYGVDMESYFRKVHATDQLEALDIALIDPASTFEFETTDYAEHLELERFIDVPLPAEAKCGAMAVTVASDTHEATTLVIQSDLDIIVKATQESIFVFAENMRTGKPWPGVHLLVSDGDSLVTEGVTGDDGVWHPAGGDLGELGEARVAAMASGHVTANPTSFRPMETKQSLSGRGYIFTDRPAYRAGQHVYVRGCIRQVVDDIYTPEADKTYTLRVSDPQNRLIRQDEVVLGDYGSFHMGFLLPPAAATGDYRIQIDDGLKQQYQGTFQVQAYQLEPVRLVVDVPRRVYYRGEDIKGSILAQTSYGAPLSGRKVTYQLGDDRKHDAMTDNEGRVHFTLSTRDFAESQTLAMKVSLPDRNVETTANFYLATQGFAIEVQTIRDTFLAGETIEATVTTTDAQGQPVGRKLTLRIMELSAVDGTVGERFVQQQPFETSAENGTGRPAFTLDRGGRFRIRVEGTDRFGHTVSAQYEVTISDDKDTSRLRILADRQTYRAGETADVTLHWRETPALALVTFESADVLDYRLVSLKMGANRLSIPMGARFAPNFQLAAAVMTDPKPADAEADKPRDRKNGNETVIRLHEASSDFVVQRELDVSVTYCGKDAPIDSVRAGDQIEVTISTCDPQGEPVPAEVSLAMVDQSLTRQFAWRTPAIHEFFRGELREFRISTYSSIDFDYRPETAPINPRLLSEQQREELARQERASLQRGFGSAIPAMGGFGGMGGMGGFGMGGGGGGGFGGETETEEHPVITAEYEFLELVETFQGPTEEPFVTSVVPVIDAEDTGLSHFIDRPANDGGGSPTARSADIDQFEHATAYWNPTIVTGPDGAATVTLTVPERHAAWTFFAKGITCVTLVGESSVDLVPTAKDLFGELKLPLAFTAGDQAQVMAVVHNSTIAEGVIKVALQTEIAGRRVEQQKELEVDGKGIYTLLFDVSLAPPEKPTDEEDRSSRADEVAFDLTVSTGDLQETSRRTVPLNPYGMTVYSTAGGVAESDEVAWIASIDEMPLNDPWLQIVVGSSIDRSLLDIVASTDLPYPTICRPQGTDMERACSDLMAGLGLQTLLATDPQSDATRARTIDGVIRTSIGHLVSAQNKDGGWAWASADGASDLRTSARVLWALSLARRGGYVVPDKSFVPLLQYVEGAIAATENRDFESKAVLLHALAVADKDNFSLANRLYRERPALDPSALLYLALALVEMDRSPMAAELVTAAPAENDGQWSVELHALHVLALLETTPQATSTETAIEWLLSHRTGCRWSPDRATGPAALALCQWFSKTQRIGEKYGLVVSVNDRSVASVDVDSDTATSVIDVPADLLIEGRQKLGFKLEGRGRFAYQAILGGHVPAEQLKGTTTEWTLERTYEPAPLEVDGRQISRGFDIVRGQTERFRNPLTQLPVGGRGRVELKYTRNASLNPLAQPQDYLVITEPIPSGAAVIEHSIFGAFDRYEIEPGAINFYVRPFSQPRIILYEVRGYLPGQYRAAPAIARDARRPEQIAVSDAKSLSVLAAGKENTDPYRLTPQELLELGSLALQQGDVKVAESHLTQLINGWTLEPTTYKRVVQQLLDVQLQLDQSEEIIRYFEIILERWPQERIPFDDSMKIGAAYHDLGEFERSYLGFRAIVESNFRQESGVAGFLASRAEFLPSIECLERLLKEYPPEPYLAAAQVALAQQVLAQASEADSDSHLRDAKVNRVDLILHGWRLLESFLSEHSDDPAADQAAFAAANALLELDKFTEAADACERYAGRYPDSKLMDSFWYIIGYCRFADGQHERADQALQKVAGPTADEAAPTSTKRPNRLPAIYILGQIYHSLGQPVKAIDYYRQVEDQFPDAKKSIAYFLRKEIKLPEVSVVRPGEPVELALQFRNIAACNTRVYRIDLMKFALLHDNLSGIARINLAGIEPHQTADTELGDGKDYRDRTKKIQLDLEDEGAYLIVCRGDSNYASGLVLITPLELEVQHDPIAEEIRATVKDATSDRYVHDAQVKVTGSLSADFVSGTTDRRGLVVAEGIAGTPTVIAQSGPGRYAFFRGKSAGVSLPPEVLRQLRGKDMSAIAAGVARDDPFASRSVSAGVPLSDSPASERRIERALDSPTAVDFKETELADIANFLSRQHGIPILIDKRALDDVGIGVDVPITFRASGITLRSALRSMLRELDLTYVIRDECLTIITPEEAESELATVAYPVNDLVRFRDSDEEEWADFDSLIDMITSTIEPTGWDTVGGPGAIEGLEYGNTDVIILSQTQEVHDQIEGLLNKLRTISGEGGKDGELPVREKPDWEGGYGRGWGGGYGGMGGMGGGYFGSPTTGGKRQGGRPDLLRGLHDAQKDLQRREIQKLQEMYKQGQGMGGMGGGVGAGGFF